MSYLVGQLGLDLLLEPPEQERPEHLVQAADDQDRLLLIQLHLAGITIQEVQLIPGGSTSKERRRERRRWPQHKDNFQNAAF